VHQRSAAHGYDTGAWVPSRTPPSWVAGIRGTAVRVRPGYAVPLAAFVASAATTVCVVAYAAVRLDAPWSVLAGIAGLGGLALALRGFPLPAVLALLVAVACWGFVARDLVPDSWGQVGGLARLIGGNLALAVPLAAGFLAAGWVDGRRTAQAAVREALGGRRWFGVNRGDPEPQLPGLERIPSAHFFALTAGQSSHLVAAGRRVVLVATTVWPRGEYGVERNEVVRNARPYRPGTDEIDGVVDDLRTWAALLRPAGATCRAYLAVHPASERLTDRVRLALPPIEGVHVVAADDFLEAAGGFLAAEPHTIQVDVMQRLAKLRTDDQGVGAQPGMG
jgi:hypothetical protein